MEFLKCSFVKKFFLLCVVLLKFLRVIIGGSMSLNSACYKLIFGLIGLTAFTSLELSAQNSGSGYCHGEPNFYGMLPVTTSCPEPQECGYWEFCPSPCAPCEPSVDTCCSRNGYFYGIEGLWWTVYQDNLDYAVEFNNELDATEILGPGKTKFLDYDWQGGVRGTLGVVLSGWDLFATYTWYQNQSDTSTNTHTTLFELKASLLHPATPQVNAQKASLDSDITYQTLDILFGRSLIFCENSILIRPYAGLSGLQINQDLEALYEGGDFILIPGAFIGGDNADPARVLWSSDLQAIGLKAGFDMNYRWYCGFGLYGSFAGSVLASKTDIHHRQQSLDADGDVDEVLINLRNKENVCIPGYQVAAGFSWDTCCGDCFFFQFRVGYEFNHWFNTPQLRRYHDGNEGVSSDSSGNIGFHGGTLSFNFYF